MNIDEPEILKYFTERKLRPLTLLASDDVSIITLMEPPMIAVTRPKEDFPLKDHPIMQKALDLLISNGATIVFKSNIHQKFAVMDQKIVWYGSINLLSYGSAQESIMRIEGSNIANELMKSIESA